MFYPWGGFKLLFLKMKIGLLHDAFQTDPLRVVQTAADKLTQRKS